MSWARLFLGFRFAAEDARVDVIPVHLRAMLAGPEVRHGAPQYLSAASAAHRIAPCRSPRCHMPSGASNMRCAMRSRSRVEAPGNFVGASGSVSSVTMYAISICMADARLFEIVERAHQARDAGAAKRDVKAAACRATQKSSQPFHHRHNVPLTERPAAGRPPAARSPCEDF